MSVKMHPMSTSSVQIALDVNLVRQIALHGAWKTPRRSSTGINRSHKPKLNIPSLLTLGPDHSALIRRINKAGGAPVIYMGKCRFA